MGAGVVNAMRCGVGGDGRGGCLEEVEGDVRCLFVVVCHMVGLEQAAAAMAAVGVGLDGRWKHD